MQWMWIGVFSLTGVVMGLLTSLVGLPMPIEPLTWVGFYVLWGVAVVKKDLPAFTTPLIGSLGSGVCIAVVQFALWDQYVANNPWWAEEIAKRGGEANLGQIGGFALAMGLAWGLLVGGVCWGIQRFRKR